MKSPILQSGCVSLTLERALRASSSSSVVRGELFLGSQCTFGCDDCQFVHFDYTTDMEPSQALKLVQTWAAGGAKEVRFNSVGETTLYPDLPMLIRAAKSGGIPRVRVATIGCVEMSKYVELLEAGVTHVDITMPECLPSGPSDAPIITVHETAAEIAKYCFVSLGLQLDGRLSWDLVGEIIGASEAGVQEIRLIDDGAAIALDLEDAGQRISKSVLEKHPHLAYRLGGVYKGDNVFGLAATAPRRCFIPLDDCTVFEDFHFPCALYALCGGKPIGKVGPNMHKERVLWSETHDCLTDSVCIAHCLDIYQQYNSCCSQLQP